MILGISLELAKPTHLIIMMIIISNKHCVQSVEDEEKEGEEEINIAWKTIIHTTGKIVGWQCILQLAESGRPAL